MLNTLRQNMMHVPAGAWLALLIVVFLPNFGIEKYGPSPLVPTYLLLFLGAWIFWKKRAALASDRAIHRLLLVFLLLWIPALFSLTGSYNRGKTLQVILILFLYFWVGVALVQALRQDDTRQWLAKWVTVCLVLWILDALIQFVVGQDVFGIPLGPNRRILGPFAENLRLPVMLVLLLPMGLAYLLNRRALFALILFIAGGAVAVLTGVRTVLPWLGMVAIAVYWRTPRKPWKLPMLIGAMVLVGLATALSPGMQERLARFTTIERLDFQTLDRVLSLRLSIWSTALYMAERRPWTGVGAGAFASAYDSFATRSDDVFVGGLKKVHHAHQAYLALAAECGIAGVVGLFVILGLAIHWYGAAPPDRRQQAWPYGLGLLVYAFPINSQQPLFAVFNSLFPVLVLLLAAFLAALEGRPGGTLDPERVSSSP